jgi:hypothetical protein
MTPQQALDNHLKGTASPEQLFQSVRGIGPWPARRVCETLHVHTLEGLQAVAHDGRMEQVKGFGHRRAAMVRTALADMLARVRRSPLVRSAEPDVELLLDVDREYRRRAGAGDLKDCPEAVQPQGGGLAAAAPYCPRRLAFQCTLFEYCTGPRARAGDRLGNHLFPQGQPSQRPVHRSDRDPRRNNRATHRPRPRGGMPYGSAPPPS